MFAGEKGPFAGVAAKEGRVLGWIPYVQVDDVDVATTKAQKLEAAISAVHCDALTADDTDWAQIAELYRLLEAARPCPAVRINRAFAVHASRAPPRASG